MAAPRIPGWQRQLEGQLGVPDTPQNQLFLSDWARAEGGGAANNPFNTTQPGFGATGNYNGVGVKNYATPQQGIGATAATLKNGRYGGILGALRQGKSARAAAAALAASPWGTGSLVLRMLGGGAPAGAPPPQTGSLAASTAPKPQPLPDFRTQLLSALTQSRQQGSDLTGFYGELGQAIQKRNAVAQQNAHLATAAAGPQPGPPGQPQPPGAPQPHGLAIPVHGQIGREDPHFLAELTAAARARGAVAIVATSGERTPQHNAAIGGASHSNHLPDAHGYGHALDGYAVLPDGRRVPLGTFLQPNAGRFGLRSGATFQWGGRPDVVHVDDNRNHGH